MSHRAAQSGTPQNRPVSFYLATHKTKHWVPKVWARTRLHMGMNWGWTHGFHSPSDPKARKCPFRICFVGVHVVHGMMTLWVDVRTRFFMSTNRLLEIRVITARRTSGVPTPAPGRNPRNPSTGPCSCRRARCSDNTACRKAPKGLRQRVLTIGVTRT